MRKEEEDEIVERVDRLLIGWDGKSVITPQNAPRDRDRLKEAGIFRLRHLTEKLGGIEGDAQRAGYARMTVDQKVDYAMQLLDKWDRERR